MSDPVKLKRSQRKYNLPVIGHFEDKSVRFRSILEAERITGINYNLIFNACVGKIYKAGDVLWEYEKGNHYLRYKAYYLRVSYKLKEINHS